MATKKKVVKASTFKIGDVVQTTKKFNGVKSGQIGFISSNLKTDIWQNSAGFDKPYHYVVHGTCGYYVRMSPLHLKKAVAQYAVTWATEDNDPLEYFVNLKEARSFMEKVKVGKRYQGEKVINVQLYKLVK